MNNGMQQPMPQVRTMPSNTLTQNMNNATANTNNIQNTPMNTEINTTKEQVEKAVIDAVSKNNGVKKDELNIISNEIKKDVSISADLTVHAILSALTLIVALGWNEAIKYYISRYIKFYQGSSHSLLFYALTVTLLLVLYVKLFNKKLIKPSPIPFVKFSH
tara:strand:- start:498 stop:980 length:483 start_codon:yes stop_codon:yes gene_type:complete